MYAGDFDGEIDIGTVDELSQFLRRRPRFDSNNFVLTFEESGFPQLSIFAKREFCVAYYMADGENFVSKGTTTWASVVEIFYENKLGGTVELSSQCIIHETEMLAAAEQFFATRTRPTRLNWIEL